MRPLLLQRIYIAFLVALFTLVDGSSGFFIRRIPLGMPTLISTTASTCRCGGGGAQIHSSSSGTYFPESSDPPFLAIITEPNACDSDDNMESTFEAIRRATSNQQVDLVSVRLTRTDAPDRLARALQLTRRLVELSSSLSSSSSSFKVVCSSDFIETALKANAHGIHVKEAHLSRIPEIREAFASSQKHSSSPSRTAALIGTSSHSVESAIQSFQTYHPDYYFVGTCYATASHPEKSVDDLEGPTLAGEIRQSILNIIIESDDDGDDDKQKVAAVLAIGGIDDSNCHEPVAFGADGVATIRAVLQANDPAEVVARLKARMKESLDKREKEDPS